MPHLPAAQASWPAPHGKAAGTTARGPLASRMRYSARYPLFFAAEIVSLRASLREMRMAW
jgi:hypothetical protein